MGRKKKRAAPDPLQRIFCYYCDRNFQTEQMLLMHQREKHLRCPTCHKRMLSIPSMVVHSSQMHNASINKVPNAIPGREDVAVDVLGMKGIPDEYYAALDPARTPKTQRTTPSLAAAPPPSPYAHAPLPHAPYGGYQNGTTTYPAAYPPQPYGQNAYPPNAYSHTASPHPAYPHPAYPQSTYPHTSYAQSGYPPTHVMQYPLTYGHGQQPYAAAPQRPYPPSQPQYHSPVHTSRSAPALAAQPANWGSQPPKATVALNAAPAVERKADDVKIVFDRLDTSMEELRAQLPRYS